VFGDRITEISVVSIPMRVNFRGLSHREALLFKGTQRWAEFSPFPEYQDQEAASWLRAALSFANDSLPHLYRTHIPINATLPAVAVHEVREVLNQFGKINTVKIKVAEPGQSIQDDIARIQEVSRLYPAARIRLDANGGYTIEQAIQLAEELAGVRIDYFEQPVGTVGELAQLRELLKQQGIDLKVAADESIRKATDPLEVARLDAADIAVLKVQPLGGIDSALAIASESGLESVVSSALETSIGISQGLHLAAALPTLNYDCGLGTLALLEGDVCSQPLKPVDGQIAVAEISPEPELLLKYAASPERTAWWLARLTRCLELLES
jgi:O-succinylbenzoate synthase